VEFLNIIRMDFGLAAAKLGININQRQALAVCLCNVDFMCFL
jgi:hypothetical protein